MNKIYNNLTVENLIKTECFNQFNEFQEINEKIRKRLKKVRKELENEKNIQ